MRVGFTATREVEAALGAIGRTEDAQFSPGGGLLALAGFAEDRLLILRLNRKRPEVAFDGFIELVSSDLKDPHGLLWLDEGTLIVCNRTGEVALLRLPESWPAEPRLEVKPFRTIGRDQLAITPGSVSLFRPGLGLVELLVCNNYVHHVTRHLLDERDDFAVLSSEILIERGLDIPDGVVHSPDGAWIAVSNHLHHSVFLYRNDARLGRAAEPDGKLLGIAYPHGLKFLGDGSTLLVADAGAPYVQVFTSEDGSWSGEHGPARSIEVLDEETFRRGNFHPTEGGPKGLSMTPDGSLLVTSCHEQVLGFWDMRALGLDATAPAPAGEPEEIERARETLLKCLSSASRRAEQGAEAVKRSHEWALQVALHGRPRLIADPVHHLEASLDERGYREEVTEQGVALKLRNFPSAIPHYPHPHVAIEAALPGDPADWPELARESAQLARSIASGLRDRAVLERAAAYAEASAAAGDPWSPWIPGLRRAFGLPAPRLRSELLGGGRVRLRLADAHPLAAVECAVLGLHLLWLAHEGRDGKAPQPALPVWQMRLRLAGIGAAPRAPLTSLAESPDRSPATASART
jgi:hypothetical protein